MSNAWQLTNIDPHFLGRSFTALLMYLSVFLKTIHFLLRRGRAPPFSMSRTSFSLATWKSFILWIKFCRDGFLTPENQKMNKQTLKQLQVLVVVLSVEISDWPIVWWIYDINLLFLSRIKRSNLFNFFYTRN